MLVDSMWSPYSVNDPSYYGMTHRSPARDGTYPSGSSSGRSDGDRFESQQRAYDPQRYNYHEEPFEHHHGGQHEEHYRGQNTMESYYHQTTSRSMEQEAQIHPQHAPVTAPPLPATAGDENANSGSFNVPTSPSSSHLQLRRRQAFFDSSIQQQPPPPQSQHPTDDPYHPSPTYFSRKRGRKDDYSYHSSALQDRPYNEGTANSESRHSHFFPHPSPPHSPVIMPDYRRHTFQPSPKSPPRHAPSSFHSHNEYSQHPQPYPHPHEYSRPPPSRSPEYYPHYETGDPGGGRSSWEQPTRYAHRDGDRVTQSDPCPPPPPSYTNLDPPPPRGSSIDYQNFSHGEEDRFRRRLPGDRSPLMPLSHTASPRQQQQGPNYYTEDTSRQYSRATPNSASLHSPTQSSFHFSLSYTSSSGTGGGRRSGGEELSSSRSGASSSGSQHRGGGSQHIEKITTSSPNVGSENRLYHLDGRPYHHGPVDTPTRHPGQNYNENDKLKNAPSEQSASGGDGVGPLLPSETGAPVLAASSENEASNSMLNPPLEAQNPTAETTQGPISGSQQTNSSPDHPQDPSADHSPQAPISPFQMYPSSDNNNSIVGTSDTKQEITQEEIRMGTDHVTTAPTDAALATAEQIPHSSSLPPADPSEDHERSVKIEEGRELHTPPPLDPAVPTLVDHEYSSRLDEGSKLPAHEDPPQPIRVEPRRPIPIHPASASTSVNRSFSSESSTIATVSMTPAVAPPLSASRMGSGGGGPTASIQGTPLEVSPVQAMIGPTSSVSSFRDGGMGPGPESYSTPHGPDYGSSSSSYLRRGSSGDRADHRVHTHPHQHHHSLSNPHIGEVSSSSSGGTVIHPPFPSAGPPPLMPHPYATSSSPHSTPHSRRHAAAIVTTESSSYGRFSEQRHAPHHHQQQHYHHEPHSSSVLHHPPPQPFRQQRRRQGGSAWYDRLEELRAYKERHGHCSVPQKYPENPSLGIWVNKQRMEFKQLQDGKKSSMTPERIRALEEVGFTWAKRKGQPVWDTKFAELCEYKRIHGDALVPTKYADNPALGRWVSTQRAAYRAMQDEEKTSMTKERAAKLESIGFVWRLQF